MNNQPDLAAELIS